jgi:hypothetical protein
LGGNWISCIELADFVDIHFGICIWLGLGVDGMDWERLLIQKGASPRDVGGGCLPQRHFVRILAVALALNLAVY